MSTYIHGGAEWLANKFLLCEMARGSLLKAVDEYFGASTFLVFPWSFSMEAHRSPWSVDVHGRVRGRFHGPPWNSVELRRATTEFHGGPRTSTEEAPWTLCGTNARESFHGIPDPPMEVIMDVHDHIGEDRTLP